MPTCSHCKSEISWDAMQVLSACRCGAPLPVEKSPFEAVHSPQAQHEVANEVVEEVEPEAKPRRRGR